MAASQSVTIIIPAYNEEKTLGAVLRDLKRAGYDSVIVIDDGSRDRTSEVAHAHDVTVIRHIINRGLGGAIGTGIAAALSLTSSDYYITIDADGQHDIKDITAMLKTFKKQKSDVIIGSRLMNPKGMPLHRQVANRLSNYITFAFFGIWTTDSQSGFRGMTRHAAERINIRTNRMEVSSEFIREIKRNRLSFTEIPIRVIYTEYSLSKGQSFSTGIRTLYRLILYMLIRN